MIKEYGKLTRPQLQRVAKLLPHIRQDFDSLPEIIKAAPAEKVRDILGENFQSAFAYELPLAVHVALIIVAFGQGEKLKELAASDDPQEALLTWMGQESTHEIVAPFEKGLVFGLIVALLRSIRSIMIYGRPMSTLVEEVRAGNDASLFLAVRMDRSSVSCPTLSSRIARAELENDEAFFHKLRAAFKGPLRKHMEALKDMRYVLVLLAEMGIERISDADLEDLLVHQLKLYPNVPSARKNLRKQFSQARKFSTT